MSRRVKEEERIERIIHGLLKLPENRRCINCNSLGPQYVCTTFWTFICSTCSGVHRGFTHRVKSVSAAKFNAEEVDSLQAGGNERAKEIYFKSWDPRHNSCPDGRNIQRLREFIKHVYVDRRYAGVRNTDSLAMVKVGGKDDSYDRYSYEKYTQESKDDYYGRPTFEKSNLSGKNEVRTLKYYIEERSPRHKPENSMRTSSQRSRRAFFEIVDDRVRDDAHGSGRRSGRFTNVEAGTTSDDPQKGRGTVSPPVVRPLKEILGENIPPLTVGKVAMDNHGKDTNAGACADVDAQKTESSSSPKAVEEKVAESKTAMTSSLIDFSMEPEVSDTAAVQETQQIVPYVNAGNSTESSTMNTSKPQNVNSVESLLFELSALAIVPASTTSEAPNTSDASPALPIVLSNEVGATITGSTTNTPSVPSYEILALPSSTGEYNTAKANEGQQLVTMQHYQPSVLAAGDSGSNCQQSISLYNQPWTPSPAPNAQEPVPPNASADKSSEATNSGDVAKSIGRKELPADLFTLGYSSYTAPVPSWQFRPSHGLGYNMQYHPNAMSLQPMSAFPNSARSRNPFDLGNDTPQIQDPMFPSQPQPSPYPTAMPPYSAPYGMAMPPGAYMGQQQPNDMPVSRPQRTSSTGSADAAFASLNSVHKSNSAYASPNGPNSFSSMGGNPFG